MKFDYFDTTNVKLIINLTIKLQKNNIFASSKYN